MTTKQLHLNGLDCANCAQKIEKAVQALPEVTEANVDFMQARLSVTTSEQAEGVTDKIKNIVAKIEPEVAVTEEATAEEPSELPKILASLALLVIVTLLPISNPWLKFGAYLLPYLLAGGEVLKTAWQNIIHGQVFDENFLMSLATLGAFAIGEYPEAVAVMVFYQIGEYFQSIAVNRSRRSIQSLVKLRPDTVQIQRAGEVQNTPLAAVKVGEQMIVQPGERIALDGVILAGSAVVDTSALTGESRPQAVNVGSEVLSGMINKDGLLTVEVTTTMANSTLQRIMDLVENATAQKAPAENFITKFARYYTPIVVVAAALLAVIPPLFFQADFSEWLYRALTFLVISCPCALVVSVPLSFFGGIGGASKAGILIKGSNYLEVLANVDTVVFDKTGTLTKGNFAVEKIVAARGTESELLDLTASVEQYSNHPIAHSIVTAAKNLQSVTDLKEIAGHGVRGTVAGEVVLAGNRALLAAEGIETPEVSEIGTLVYVAVAGEYAGYLVINDQIKADAAAAIQRLHQLGVKQTVMLTGDSANVANAVSQELGLDQVYSQLLPADKVTKIEALATGTHSVAFVGDGLNDAPVLARADVGIAMGGVGSDAAIEAADVVLMNDEPSKVATAVQVARKTMRIVKQNIFFAIGIKLIVLVLGALGIASMGAAVFADVGVTVLAVLNAVRALSIKGLK